MSKITIAKWIRGVAQAVEYLLCNHKALSSNSSPTKKKVELVLEISRGLFYFV
jgi:hypothetical protein